jgi:hypothetical protein
VLRPFTPARIARRVQGDVERAALRARNRDRQGRRRDVLVLAHLVDETWSSMATLGIDNAL